MSSTNKICNICGGKMNSKIMKRCSKCREGICDICDKPCEKKFKKCYDCFLLTTSNKQMGIIFENCQRKKIGYALIQNH